MIAGLLKDEEVVVIVEIAMVYKSKRFAVLEVSDRTKSNNSILADSSFNQAPS
jgi:hypothetical protein